MKREEHPINTIIEEAIEKINKSINVDKIIGNPIDTNNNEIVIPISKVSVGFVAGGGEYNQNIPPKNAEKEFPFAGGSGAGFNVTPVGFLVCNSLGTKYIDINASSSYDKILETVKNITKVISKKA